MYRGGAEHHRPGHGLLGRGARNPEVEQLDVNVLAEHVDEHHVLGFDVPVDETPAMRAAEAFDDLQGDGHHALGGQRTVGENRVERAAVDELHDEIRQPAGRFAPVEHPDDVRVVEFPGVLRLEQESADGRAGFGHRRVHDLDRHRGARAQVERAVHRPHAADADARFDLVLALDGRAEERIGHPARDELVGSHRRVPVGGARRGRDAPVAEGADAEVRGVRQRHGRRIAPRPVAHHFGVPVASVQAMIGMPWSLEWVPISSAAECVRATSGGRPRRCKRRCPLAILELRQNVGGPCGLSYCRPAMSAAVAVSSPSTCASPVAASKRQVRQSNTPRARARSRTRLKTCRTPR
jgi:hypothetical protein